MKEVFLDKAISFIKKYNNYDEEQTEKLRYGLEGIYLTITKLIIILIIAIILNIVKELIIVLIFFNIIRFPAFGVHANKSIICLISSTLLLLGLTYIVFRYNINFNIKFILSVLALITYPIFAPADTEKRPLTNKKKRKYRKIGSIIVSLLYFTVILFEKNVLINNSVFIALILEAIMINPLTYKLFRTPYNNYKRIKYESI